MTAATSRPAARGRGVCSLRRALASKEFAQLPPAVAAELALVLLVELAPAAGPSDPRRGRSRPVSSRTARRRAVAGCGRRPAPRSTGSSSARPRCTSGSSSGGTARTPRSSRVGGSPSRSISRSTSRKPRPRWHRFSSGHPSSTGECSASTTSWLPASGASCVSASTCTTGRCRSRRAGRGAAYRVDGDRGGRPTISAARARGASTTSTRDSAPSTRACEIAHSIRSADGRHPPRRGCSEAELRALENATGIEVDLQVEGNLSGLSDSQKIVLFRVVQEALSNVRKHSAAGRVSVALRSRRTFVDVTVTDDGCGFRPQHLDTDRLGLAGISERVRLPVSGRDRDEPARGRLSARPCLPSGVRRSAAATIYAATS